MVDNWCHYPSMCLCWIDVCAPCDTARSTISSDHRCIQESGLSVCDLHLHRLYDVLFLLCLTSFIFHSIYLAAATSLMYGKGLGKKGAAWQSLGAVELPLPGVGQRGWQMWVDPVCSCQEQTVIQVLGLGHWWKVGLMCCTL